MLQRPLNPPNPQYKLPVSPIDADEVLAPNGFATRCIRYRVDMLVYRHVIPTSDRDDICQEVALRLFQILDRHDPDRSQASTYIVNMVRYILGNILRHLKTFKRRAERETTALGSLPPPNPETGITFAETMTPYDSIFGRGEVPDDLRMVDLRSDIATVVETLAPELQAYCAAVLEDREVPALSPAQIELLREHLQQSDVCDYFESHS